MVPVIHDRRAASAAPPYRHAAPVAPEAEPLRASRAPANLDLLVALTVLWIVSVGRVWFSLGRGEPAGAELTLAGLSVCLLPVLLVRELAARWAARR